MADAQSILELVLTAKDEATGKIAAMGDELEKTGKKAVNLSQTLKLAGGTITGFGMAGVAVMTDWTNAAAKSQNEMATTHAAFLNVSKAMQEQVVVIGGHTTSLKAQTKQITETNAALNLKIQSLRLSGKGHEDEIKSIQKEILANKEHALSLKDSGTTASYTTTIIKKQTESVDDLWKAVEKASKATIKLGFDDEDSAAALVKNLGATKDMKQAQVMLNAEMELARAKHMDLADAAQLLNRAYVLGGASLARQGIMVDKQAKGMDVVNAVLNKYQGTVAETNKTAEQAFQNAMLAVDNFKEDLGARLLPVVTDITLKFTAFANKLLELPAPMVDMIVKVTLFATAFALVVGPLLLLVGFLPALVAGFGLIAPVLLPLVAVLAAVAAAGYYVYTNWNTLSSSFEYFWQFVAPRVKIAVDIIVMYAQLMFLEIQQFWAEHGAAIMTTLQNFWVTVQGLFLFGLGFIQGFWGSTWQNMVQVLQGVWEIIKGVVQAGWGAVQIIFAVGMGIFTGNWGKALGTIKEGWENLWNGLKGFTQGMTDSLIAIVKGMVNGIIGAINGVISGINSVGKLSGNKTTIPQIPHLAAGTSFFQGGMALVGEAGPELVALPRGSQVIPNTQINNYTRNPQITIGPVYVQNQTDIDLLVQKLSMAMKYDSSY